MNQMSLTHFVNKKVIGKTYVQNNVSILKKGLQFQKVRTQLTNLKLNLLDINPSKDYSQYETVFGYSGAKFYLSQWVTRANQNHLKCVEIGGKPIGLHTVLEEKLSFGQKTIVTGDKFFVNDNRLACFINEVEMQGISCTRQLKNFASEYDKSIGPWSPAELYAHLLNEYVGGTTLYVFVNSTHIHVSDKEESYVFCKIETLSNSEFRDSTAAVVQRKYYAHLSDLYSHLIHGMELELDLLQSIAIYGAHRKVDVSLTDSNGFCSDLALDLLVDVGLTGSENSVPKDHFQDFLVSKMTSYVSLSARYKDITKQALSECTDDEWSYFVKGVIAEHLSMTDHVRTHFTVFSKRHGHKNMEIRNLLCSDAKTCLGMSGQLEAAIGGDLTSLECSYLFIEVYNSVARFVNNICRRSWSPCPTFDLIAVNGLHVYIETAKVKASFVRNPEDALSTASVEDNNTGPRSPYRTKRWFYTDFLSAVSGLARESAIDKLNVATTNLKHVEDDNAGEIVKLEKKSNDIIERISRQNEKMMSLYKDENTMNVKLTDLLREDASLSKQMSLLVKSLEVTSDIAIEFAVVQTILELIPVLIAECRETVESVYTGVLPADVSVQALRSGSRAGMLPNTYHAEVVVFHDELSVLYYIPSYVEFQIVHISFLPFTVKGSPTCFTVSDHEYVVAVNLKGQFFEYDANDCVVTMQYSVCASDRIVVRTKPLRCSTHLALGSYSSLPRVCRENLRVSSCKQQEFFRRDESVFLFSPYEDVLEVTCDELVFQERIQRGITHLNSSHCTFQSAELYIMRVWNKAVVVPTNTTQGLAGVIYNIDTVLDDITTGESINLSNQTSLLKSLLAARETESMDLSAAVTELEKFKKVDYLTNYTLFNFQLDNPLGLSSSVTGAYVTLAFILMLLPILCCCTCKCFRKAAQKLITNLFKFIWWLLKGVWQFLWSLITRGRVAPEEALCTPGPEVSVSFRPSGRDTADASDEPGEPVVAEDEQLTFETSQDFERRRGARRRVPQSWDRELEQVLEQRNNQADSSPRLRTNTFGGLPCRRSLPFDSGSTVWLAPRFESSPIPSDESLANQPLTREHVADRQRMFTMDFSPILARSHVVADVASQWRLEHLADRSVRLAKGISFETLVFDPLESKVRNASGLEVVCEPPEPYVKEKLYHLRGARGQVATRFDPSMKLLGIHYPKFVDQGRRGLVWCYESIDGLTAVDM
jgi:hypothetical protein